MTTSRKYTPALCALLLALCVAVSGGCGIYRINVQQGNYLDDKRIRELKVGMTKRQVEFLLGTPAIRDSFHQNRWDYVFYFRNGKTDRVNKRNLVVIFDGDRVAELELPEGFDGSV